MAKLTSLVDPVPFNINPATGGLNISVNPRAIDMREASDLYNVRVYNGQISTRHGFKGKYVGARERLIYIDFVYSTVSTQTLFALSAKKAYHASGLELIRIPIYTGDGTGTFLEGTNPLDSFIMANGLNWWASAGGKTRLQPFDINAGAMWPNVYDYGDLVVAGNDSDGIVVIGETGFGIEAELLRSRDATPAPDSGRAFAFYGGRLIVGAPKGAGGFVLTAYLQWSAPGRIDLWDASNGGGSQLIGDDSDAIQAMQKLGEYLIVYKERNIYIGYATFNPLYPFNFQPAPAQAIGMAAPLTIGELGEEHIFLGWDNVYKFSLSGVKPIGDKVKQDLLYGKDGIIPSYISSCIGIIAEEFDEYWLFCPTGKAPAYSDGADIPNWCPNPDMNIAEISGGTVLSSNMITGISTSDIQLCTVGCTLRGAGIPTGATAMLVGASTIIMSGVATKTTLKNKIAVLPDGPPDNQWYLVGGNPDSLSYEYGGVFGAYYNRLHFLYIYTGILGAPIGIGPIFPGRSGPKGAPSAKSIKRPFKYPGAFPMVKGSGPSYATYATMRSGAIDFGQSIVGHDLSIVAWLRADGPCSVQMTINQENGTQLYTLPITFDSAVSTFAPFVFDAEVLSGGGEQHFTVDLTLNTPLVHLDIDAVELIDLTGQSPVSNLYIDQSTGYKALAMKALPGSSPLMIPFIIDKIGLWACDTVWVYNYQNESWWRWRMLVSGFGFDALTATVTIAQLTGTVAQQTWRFDDKLIVSLSPTNLISAVDGQIYEVSPTYLNDYQGLLDRAVLNYWQSKDFDLGRPDLDKTLSRLTINHDPSHPATVVTVSASTDGGATWIDQIVTIRTGHTETYADFFVTGTKVRFKVTAETGMYIDGFGVKVIARGEANAY